MSDLTAEQLAAAALAPKSASVDGQSVTARGAEEIIALDKYALSKQAATFHPFKALRRAQIKLPQAGGPDLDD
jgi:hypothetical protein